MSELVSLDEDAYSNLFNRGHEYCWASIDADYSGTRRSGTSSHSKVLSEHPFRRIGGTFRKYCEKVDMSRMTVNARKGIGEYEFHVHSRFSV